MLELAAAPLLVFLIEPLSPGRFSAARDDFRPAATSIGHQRAAFSFLPRLFVFRWVALRCEEGCVSIHALCTVYVLHGRIGLRRQSEGSRQTSHRSQAQITAGETGVSRYPTGIRPDRPSGNAATPLASPTDVRDA